MLNARDPWKAHATDRCRAARWADAAAPWGSGRAGRRGAGRHSGGRDRARATPRRARMTRCSGFVHMCSNIEDGAPPYPQLFGSLGCRRFFPIPPGLAYPPYCGVDDPQLSRASLLRRAIQGSPSTEHHAIGHPPRGNREGVISCPMRGKSGRAQNGSRARKNGPRSAAAPPSAPRCEVVVTAVVTRGAAVTFRPHPNNCAGVRRVIFFA
jgi:hypothetical protein